MANFSLINTSEQIPDAVKDLEQHSVLSLDCEGVFLSRKGLLCIVQLGTPTGHVYLFDIIVLCGEPFEKGLKRILESSSIVKIIHDCRRDSDALFHQFGVRLGNVFDTQVADIWIRKNYKMAMPKYVNSYVKLLAYYLDESVIDLTDKNAGTELLKRDNDVWLKRPLDPSLIGYAVTDVIHLHSLKKAMEARMFRELTNGMECYLACDRDKNETPEKPPAKPPLNPDDFEFIADHLKKTLRISGPSLPKNYSQRGAECMKDLFQFNSGRRFKKL